MKAIKRKFLDADEILLFNASNNFEIERHFSAINMNFENNTLNLWFERSYAVIPDSIIVEAIRIFMQYLKSNYPAKQNKK